MGLELLIVDEISPINSNFTNDSTGVEIVFLHAAEHGLFLQILQTGVRRGIMDVFRFFLHNTGLTSIS